ncbi:signal peptidase I [Ruminococcus sp.]|uniref:signal peptidase I n=1 Tax=Ruminococcus sp. TaxID=41978 RepID=UPI0025CBFA15|nr:signal peptidase I [Ruminococcus sp.]MBQ6251965.1 signal peptidase I [Ruminococcus sp.]
MMEEKQKKSSLMSIIRRIYDIIATLLIALAAVVAVLWIAGIRPYAVVSGSMEPAVHVGSVCIVDQHASYKKVAKNDIIAFRVGTDTLVTHRAVRITADGIITKGDANNAEDAEPVTKDNFVGRTLFSIPKIGYFIGFVHTRRGLIASAAALAAFILFGAAVSEKKEKKKE